MDYNVLIRRLLRVFSSATPKEIESAIVRGVLKTHAIKETKNKLITKITSQSTEVTEQVLDWFRQEEIKPNLQLLEKFYELNIDQDERKINGAYYTPENIITYIVDETLAGKTGTICDPACGSGAFLAEASRYLKRKTKLSYKTIYRRFIFGVDILPSNRIHTETILSLQGVIAGEDEDKFDFNLFTADSLIFEWKSKIKNFDGFDFVIGNPPYVRAKNLDTDVRKNLSRWETASFGNPDLYIPFFELGLQWINKRGRVGYITPSTYLTSVNATLLRKYLLENQAIKKILDFNGLQIFKGATTYTCISILTAVPNNQLLFTLVDSKEKLSNLKSLKFTPIQLSTLGTSEWRLLRKEDAENISKIENAGVPLYKYVNRFVTGIATLNNDLFLVDDNNSLLLEKSHGGFVYKIERKFTKPIIKPNKVKDEKALKNNHERIIYPYKFTREGKIQPIPEADIAKLFPHAYDYLLAIKDKLSLRDKGGREYAEWYAYGRSQGIKDFGKKIILPMMGNRPSFITVNDPESLIYCGYALFAKSEEDYEFLEKILNSEVMWYYIKKTSKNYSGGFKSFAKNYVKNFSIPLFTEEEKKLLLRMDKSEQINQYLWKKYGLV